MSLISNTLIGFFSLSTTSVASFLLANSGKQKVILLPPPPTSTYSVVEESIKNLIKEGYKGCANLKSGSWGTFFYVCVKTESSGLNSPFFFYFDKSNTKKFVQIQRIKKTESSTNSSFEIQLKEEGSRNVSFYNLPFFLRNLQNSGSNLETLFKVDGGSDSSKSAFKLMYNGKQVQNIQI